MIDCLYVYLYYNSNVLLIYFFLFSCFIRDACAAIWVAQRVYVYEWTPRTIISISEASWSLIIVIVCILLLFYVGNMQLGQYLFSLFDQRGPTTSLKL
jgi:hypothetical protein